MLEKDLKKLENNEMTLEQFIRRYGNISLDLLQNVSEHMNRKELNEDFKLLKMKNERLKKKIVTFQLLLYRSLAKGEKYLVTKKDDETVVNFKEAKLVYTDEKAVKQILFKSRPHIENKRTCSECGAEMDQGYVIEGGLEYYCGETCLHKHYTPEEWDEMYSDDGDSYWTEWEDE